MGRLWRHPDFLRLWAGETVSLFGGQVTSLALPTLAILLLHASAFQVGLLVALQFLGFPTLGLIAGVWADRLRRRPIMIIGDLGPMLALASLPIAYLLHALTLVQLYAVALCMGVFDVFFEVAYQSYLPTLIDRQDLVEGNQKLEFSHSASHIGGPAMGGVLIQLYGAALATVAGAAALLASALALLSIRKAEPQPTTTSRLASGRFLDEMRDGVQLVVGNPILRSTAACSATTSLGAYIVMAVWLLFAYRRLQLSPSQVGFVLTLGSLGYIPGALAAAALPKALGLGRTLTLASLTQGLGFVGIPLALFGAPIPILITMWLLINLPSPVFSINQISLRQLITPDRLQGRVNATMRTLVWATMPVGSLVGGIFGSVVGVPQTLLLGGLISLLAPVWLVSGPVIALREHPAPAPS